MVAGSLWRRIRGLLAEMGRPRLVLFAASCNVAVGAAVLFGWQHGIEFLKRVGPGMVAMNPLTACCLLLCGIAIALHHRKYEALAAAIGVLVATAGLAKLIDFIMGGLPVDRLLFSNRLDGGPGPLSNGMALNTAIGLFLLGVALALSASRRRAAHLVAQILSIAVLLISLAALIGYGLGIEQLATLGPFVPMALHTGLSLTVGAVGTIALSVDTKLMLVLRDPGPAGTLARRVVPLAVFVPIAVGAAELWGEQLGFYGVGTGTEIMVLANVLVTAALLGAAIFALYRSDCARKHQEMALRRSEHLNRTINEASPDCVSLLDRGANVLFSNEAVIRAYGLEGDSQLLGRRWGHLLSESAQGDRDSALAAAAAGGIGRLRLSLPTPSGELRWFESLISKLVDSDDQPFRYIVMSRDITQQKSIEDQVRWSAMHDALTQLPNRAFFQVRLQQTCELAPQLPFALLLLDVDDFKQINDTVGHDAGDSLLCTIAGRLRQSLRSEDFVARLGGDEFGIILHGVSSEMEAAAAGDTIIEALKEPWLYEGRVADCRVSIGASIAFVHGNEPSELLKKADMALYAAKTQHRGRLAVFRASMRAKMQKRSSERALARDALRGDMVQPFYQPKVELISGRIVGFEALMRWRDPAGSLRSPSSVGAAFEDIELACEITDRVLTYMLRDMRRWLDAGIEFGHVAVNAAAADFKQKDFAERLLERLDASDIPTSRVQIEVTETVFLGRGAEYVERALKTLSASGIRIALDDFGTGYASLSHLKQFPIEVVKIDRSFLRDITDMHNYAIVRTVVSLGRSLQLEVVAEGVETQEQRAYLLSQGCHLGQGYLYGRAAPATRIPAFVEGCFTQAQKNAA